MKLNDFSYDLPEKLIAQYPLKKRDEARLLIINRAEGTIKHDVFKNIHEHLPKDSHLVLNESKVVPARLLGQKNLTNAKIEVFLLKKNNDGTYNALLKPLKRLKNNDRINFNGGSFYCEVVDREQRTVRFNSNDIQKELEQFGHMPLPPYISRTEEALDKEMYQTVYANHEGSVASPTAGLHFTNELLEKCNNHGHHISKVTLHVNYGTFKPVEVENIKDHQMHSEEYQMQEGVFQQLCEAKINKRPIVSVGTTSLRVLESVAQNKTLSGQTNIFIYPGYKFQMTDCLITNFHQPRTTLLMLAYAFGGIALMKDAYRQAIEEKYRFFSYGDGMLII